MKRFLSLILIFLLLCGCGAPAVPSATETAPTPETTPADEAPKDTTPTESTPAAPEGTAPDTQPTEKKGCGSAVTVTGGLLAATIAGAVLTLWKKKEN